MTKTYDWRLIEFLEFKKGDILAGLSKTSAHNAYKRGLQLILESEPLENISIAIMKQLTQKIQESDEVNIYRKEDVLKICGERCYEEIDGVIQLEIKRRKLEASIIFNPSTPTPIGTTMNNGCEAQRNNKESNNQTKSQKSGLLLSLHKPILSLICYHQKLFPGLNPLKVGFPEIAKEIEIHAQEQTKLTSLGPTLTKWL
nr:5662_t:CDS:2 [Entrophospora candida]